VTGRAAGRFITLEGGEGAGKSTQIARLKDWLEGRGHRVLTTREPGGSPGAEMIRKLLVEGPVERWDGTTEALLHFAARREHLRSTVWPALKRGEWVVSDRFADSTLAYQGAGRGLDPLVLAGWNAIATGGLVPDLTFLFDLDPEVGLARRASASVSTNRLDRESLAFHQRVRARYLELAASEPERWNVLDATASHEQLESRVREGFENLKHRSGARAVR